MKFNPLFVAGIAGACLSLAACDSKAPGEDSVATVDGYEITMSELTHELAESGVRNTEDPVVRRAALQAIINRKLLANMAQETELDRTPEFILREQRMRDVLLADAAVQSLSPKDSQSNLEAIDAYLETNLGGGSSRTIYAIDGLQFARPAQPEVMEKLGAARTFGQLTAALQEAGIQPQSARLTWDSASMPTELVAQLDRLPPGEPFLIPEGNSVMAGVIRDRQVQPINPQQARLIAQAAVGQQTAMARTGEWLQQARGSAKIEYAEGFAPDPTDAGPTVPGAPTAAGSAGEAAGGGAT